MRRSDEASGGVTSSATKGLLVAITDPISAEREADYHRWYDGVQIPGFLAMPGITRVARYRSSTFQMRDTTPVPNRYIALYDIDARDGGGLAGFADRQFEAYQAGKVGNRSPTSDAYNQQTSSAIYYAQIGERFGPPVAVPKNIMMVYTMPASPAQEAEYNRWYSQVHLADVTSVPGFVAATRYRITDLNVGRQFKPWPVSRTYLAVYELDADGPGELAQLGAALRDRPNPTRSDALGQDELRAMTQIYERVSGPFFPTADGASA